MKNKPELQTLIFAGLFLTSVFAHGAKLPLYDQLHGLQGITRIVDAMLLLHPTNHDVHKHFEHTNMSRFRDKLIEYLCEISDGPCDYSGDTMLLVHGGMNVSESDFNGLVDLLIKALDQNEVSLAVRNQLLARLAKLRPDIIYQ
ncbi:MAG: group 1 truncated hemoglobin [Pseudomonadales bacterium]